MPKKKEEGGGRGGTRARTVCRFKGELGKKRGGEVVFEGGVDTPMHTMLIRKFN